MWSPAYVNLQRVIPKTKDSRRIAFQAARVFVADETIGEPLVEGLEAEVLRGFHQGVDALTAIFVR